MASEREIAQTAEVFLCGVVGPFTWELQSNVQRNRQECRTTEGDSPVRDGSLPPERYLSRSGHVEPRLNPRGPSRKAKYYLTTDSELSRATERWEEPRQAEDSEPETMCLQAVGALCPNGNV